MTTTQSLEAQVDALTAQLRDAERLVRVQAHELARLRLNRQPRRKPICERCGALWPSVPEADACAVRDAERSGV